MGQGLTMLLPLIVVGGMLFFMSRSQKKQQQKRQEQLDSMVVGSSVVTIGGLHGKIAEINKEKSTVLLDCEGIFLEFNRTAVSTVLPTQPVIAESTPEATDIEVVEEVEETTEKTEDKE